MNRQLVLQCQKSFFFCKAVKTIEMHNLPELQNYSKLSRKKLARQAINTFWTHSLLSAAQTKSIPGNWYVATGCGEYT